MLGKGDSKMKLYHVNIKYSLEQGVAVMANSEEEARQKVKRDANSNEAVGCSYSDMTSEIVSVQCVGDCGDE